MIKYDVSSKWYKIADSGLYIGGALLGVGVGGFFHDGNSQLEDIVAGVEAAGGLLLTASSVYYRFVARKAYLNRTEDLEL